MSAYFSGTDAEMIETFGKAGIPWLASAVFNKKGETEARLDVFGVDSIPGAGQVTIDANVSGDLDQDLLDECQADIAAHVTRQTSTWVSGRSTSTTSGSSSSTPAGRPSGLPPAKDSAEHIWDYCEAVTAPEAEILTDMSITHGWEYVQGSDGTTYLFEPSGAYVGCVPEKLVMMANWPEDYLHTATDTDDAKHIITA
jgi:hypothetical protein